MRFAREVLLVLHTGHPENLRTAEQVGHQLTQAGVGVRVLAAEATHLDAALCDHQMPIGPQAAAGAELIVVAPSSIGERRRLELLFPYVKVIDAPARLCHKQLREIGASAANGDIVVLLDDERLFASSMERWLPVTGAIEWEDEAGHSSLTRWLESMAVSAQAPAASETSIPEPRTVVATWRSVAALLVELSRFRLLRTSRAARS